MPSTLFDTATASRLAKLCGMFSSVHDGERSTAAAMADRLIREAGLTWGDFVFSSPQHGSLSQPDRGSGSAGLRPADILRNHSDRLTAWEIDFLSNLAKWGGNLTANQRAWLDRIRRKVAEARPC